MGESDVTCRVLIIEDHPTFADLLRQMILLMGHDATVAHRLSEALDYPPDAFDVVFCDYSLPDGTAEEYLDQRVGTSARMVLLSGYSQHDMPPQLVKRFDACLTKPVDMEELRRVLQKHCPA